MHSIHAITQAGGQAPENRSGRALSGLVLALALALAVTLFAPVAESVAAERPIPPLPVQIASFGAAIAGDGLYVYGGHVGGTHKHSVENLSDGFFHLDLSHPERGWTDLGKVRPLQGLAMVAAGSRVCRIGGLDARNATAEEDEDLHSVTDVECFDRDDGTWTKLPPLPRGRSSHDAVAHQGKIYVVGGWQLRGKGEESVWHDTIEVLDLESERPAWRSIPQSFERRALSVAALGDRIYAFGGLGSEGPSLQMNAFDLVTETWSEATALPEIGGAMRGFGVSAFAAGDRVFLSDGEGKIHAYVPETGWLEDVGSLSEARFFHRLLPWRDYLFFVAGAGREAHLDTVEVVATAALTVPAASRSAEVVSDAKWPGFRGGGNGHAEAEDAVLEWSDGANVLWRVDLPGYGQSAPVVWNRQVFLTSVEGPEKETLILSSLDVETGEVRWRRRFQASQKIESSEMVSRGAPTPVVDSETVFAFWESGDLVALDHEGETLWHRSLTAEYGDFLGNHGVASSPVLAGGHLIVQATHDGPSFYLAVDRRTGANVWKVDRPAGVSWTTPIPIDLDGEPYVIASAGSRVEAIHAVTGERAWLFEAIEKNHVPSIAVDGEVVFVPSSAAGQSVALPREVAPGEIPESAIAWRAEGASSGFGSPLIQAGCVLLSNKAGVLSCLDKGSGEERWQHRMAEAVWASPISVGERVYFFGKKGTTTVLRVRADGPPEVLAENQLETDETVYGAAAAAESFVIRSGSEVVRVGRLAEGGEADAAGD